MANMPDMHNRAAANGACDDMSALACSSMGKIKSSDQPLEMIRAVISSAKKNRSPSR